MQTSRCNKQFFAWWTAGTPQLTLLTTLVRECKLESVTRLQCAEGLLPLWEGSIITRLTSLRSLVLNSSGLTAVPSGESSIKIVENFYLIVLSTGKFWYTKKCTN